MRDNRSDKQKSKYAEIRSEQLTLTTILSDNSIQFKRPLQSSKKRNQRSSSKSQSRRQSSSNNRNQRRCEAMRCDANRKSSVKPCVRSISSTSSYCPGRVAKKCWDDTTTYETNSTSFYFF